MPAGLVNLTALRWHIAPHAQVSAKSNNALVANTRYYEPVKVDYPITLTALGCKANVAGTVGTVRLALYEAGTNWQPGDLVVDAGVNHDISTTTLVGRTDLSVPLDPGLYLKAIQSNATPNMDAWAGGPSVGMASDPLGGIVFEMRVPIAYGAYENPGAAFTAVGETTTVPGFRHRVLMKWA